VPPPQSPALTQGGPLAAAALDPTGFFCPEPATVCTVGAAAGFAGAVGFGVSAGAAAGGAAAGGGGAAGHDGGKRKRDEMAAEAEATQRRQDTPRPKNRRLADVLFSSF
jgi:hypothetical protein